MFKKITMTTTYEWVISQMDTNPEIDVIWTGYRLLHMLNADGSATPVPQSNVTINSTLATY